MVVVNLEICKLLVSLVPQEICAGAVHLSVQHFVEQHTTLYTMKREWEWNGTSSNAFMS